MGSSLDSYLGIHTQALSLEAQRTEVLAANLANADTPNYKARDVDFKAAMAAASGQGADGTLALATTNAADLTSAGTTAGAAAGADSAAQLGTTTGAGTAAAVGSADTYQSYLKYRVPLAPSLDGNTVDEQLEESAFAQNSVR
ncbi:MAG: flagellar basal body rod protein FlgB, partial [Steroidobacteraceae bacterium]